MIEFNRVTYTYVGTMQPALQNLSLKVPIGKRSAVIGQNGCGKTTLFLLANGLYKPQQGFISWNGERLNYDRRSLIKLRQDVGLVFQNPEQQLIASTVEEDISYGLCNLGLSDAAIAPRVEQILRQFGLTDLAHKPVHQLSLGQKKRVSLADVMVLEPKLLLLDEPTAYLDPLHTRALNQTLNAIHAVGTTILVATHDLEWVYRWADWVFVLDAGQLVLEGTPDIVFAQRQKLAALQLGVPRSIELLSVIEQSIDPMQTIAQLKAMLQRD